MIGLCDQIIIGMFMWMYMLDMHEKGYRVWLNEMEMSMTIMNRIIKWIMMEHVYIYGYNVHKDYDIACDMIWDFMYCVVMSCAFGKKVFH